TTRNRGRRTTRRKRWLMPSKILAPRNCRLWGRPPQEQRKECTAGRVYLRNCCAFIARFAQTTADFKWWTTTTGRSSFVAIADRIAKRYENSAAIPDFSAIQLIPCTRIES